VIGAALPLLLVAGWEIAARTALVSPRYFPPPTVIAAMLGRLLTAGEFWGDALTTLARLAVAFLVAALAGVPLGLGMGLWRPLRRALEPAMAMLYPLPKVALLPLFLILLGVGEGAFVFTAAVTAFFQIATSTAGGAATIDPRLVEAGRNYGARGIALFRKVGRRLELTDAGHTLVARADELLARIEEIDAELAAQAEQVAGTVRIGAFQTAASAIVLPALDRLAERHPQLRVELFEAEAEESLPVLVRGGLDVAIAEEYEHAPRPHMPQLDREYLEPDEMLLVLPREHPAAIGEGPVPLKSLHASEWVAARSDTAFGDMFARVCRAVGGFASNFDASGGI